MSLAEQLEAVAKIRWAMYKQDLRNVRYSCAEELVLAHGERFQGATARNPLPRHCFHRSYRHATWTGTKWIYYEGFALRPPLPIAVHHAWIARADEPNVAIDLAWDKPEDCQYIGVPFQREYVRECFYASRKKWYGVILTHWMNYPLLTGKLLVEDVRLL